MSPRRERASALAPVALLLGATAIAIGAFFLLFEQVDVEVPSQPRGLAAQNPYYAVERVLGDLGVPASSRYGLGGLPPADHVVLLLTTDDGQRGPMAERLSGWVASGGHLMLAPAEATPTATLFDFFGEESASGSDDADSGGVPSEAAKRGAPERDATRRDAAQRDAANQRAANGDTGTALPVAPQRGGAGDTGGPPVADDLGDDDLDDDDLGDDDLGDGLIPEDALLADLGVWVDERWVGDPRARVDVQSPRAASPRRLRLNAVPTTVMWSEPTYVPDDGADLALWAAASPEIDGVLHGAVVRRLGAGRVTVLPEAGLLRSNHIDELDHALFFVDLLVADGALPAGALLVLSGDAPSITGLLWRAGWPALVSVFALALAWAWRSAMPFGPQLPVASRDRRSLLEHVEATGHFLWRHGHHGVLLAAARGRLRDRLSRRHPGLAKLDDDALAVAIAERLDLDPEETRAALTGGGGRDRRAFLAAVRALQRTWRRA